MRFISDLDSKLKREHDKTLAEGCITAVMTLVLAAVILLLQGLWYGGLIFVAYKLLVFLGVLA